MQANTDTPLEIARLTPSMSSLPHAVDTVFTTPLPMPKSAKFAIAITELIVIHSPKRSLPR